MASNSPHEYQLWMMLLEQQRRKRAFNGALEGGMWEGVWEGDANLGPHQQGSVVPGVEEIIADMTSHSMQDYIIVPGAEETIANKPSHSMQNQGVVSGAEKTIANKPSHSAQNQGVVPGAEETIANKPSHSMQDVRRQQLMLLEQQNEKWLLHIKAQQETEEMKRERKREGDGNNADPNQQGQSLVVSSVEKSIVDMPGFFGGHQIPPMQQSTERLLMARREEEERGRERERERENDAGSSQQGRDVEQQHRDPYETNTNLSNPVAAPSGVPPQFHPNQQFRPTGSHKEASRRVMGGRVESHTRPQRTRGTERERHEEMAARLAEFERLGNLILHSDDAAWFEIV
jgi:hypothetical protein